MVKKRINNDLFIRWKLEDSNSNPILLDNADNIIVEVRSASTNAAYEVTYTIDNEFLNIHYLAKDQNHLGKYDIYLSYTVNDVNSPDGIKTITMDYCNAFELMPKTCALDDEGREVNISGTLSFLTYSTFTDEEKDDLAQRVANKSGAEYLKDLLDVNISNPSTGESIVFDGNKWISALISPSGDGSNVMWGTEYNSHIDLIVNSISKTISLQGHEHQWDDIQDKPLSDSQFQLLLSLTDLWKIDAQGNLYTNRDVKVYGDIQSDTFGSDIIYDVNYLLSQAMDVNITSVEDNDYLKYVNGVWINSKLPSIPSIIAPENEDFIEISLGEDIYNVSIPGHKHDVSDIEGLDLSNIFDSLTEGNKNQYFRGDKRWANLTTTAVPEGKNLYFTKERVLAILNDFEIDNHTHSFSSITNKPTNLKGYGITDAYTKKEIDDILDTDTHPLGVRSVGFVVPKGFKVSKSPVTYKGNIELSFEDNYALPSLGRQHLWNIAYEDSHVHANMAILNEISPDFLDMLDDVEGHINVEGNPHNTKFSQLKNIPNTLAGYNISDVYTKSQIDNLLLNLPGSSGGGSNVNIISSTSWADPTDTSVYSSLKTDLLLMFERELTSSYINNAISNISNKFISKEYPDYTSYKVSFLDGIDTTKISSINHAPGITGTGFMIDEDGNAELKSLLLRTFLEAPELRFNRIEIIAGDLWNTKGAGIIEEVDTVNQIITLKLEKGDIGRFRYDDIVMGIFHSFNDEDNSVDSYDDGIGNRRYSGFATSYFRVTQILDAEYYSRFRYELRPISPRHPKQFHPQPFMTCAQYGNFTNAERQTSMYQTTSYIRLLRNVNNWEFGIENIGMQWGDMSNLSIFGLDMTGYSAYMENVYFSGIIHQLSAKIKEQLDAQRVGGKNLLREYDIRFGFKYWGNAGEYTEFDMNLIESTPQLQVQPNTLNWTFPIRYGTIVITANGVWNITTPNWVNAFPAVGSGNKNVDLKANEYKGRDARTGIVAIQSGVIQRNVSISQAGLAEFVTIDPILNVGYGAQTITITGKSNSRKLTFSVDTGYLDINLPAQYKVNGANVSNGSLIAGDPGALDEYSFSITVAVGENVEEFSIQNNIFATAEGGQKAISTIVQRRTRIKILADADNSVISIGDMIFHIN